ncbi:ATP-binding protein [Streptomyces kaempferi]
MPLALELIAGQLSHRTLAEVEWELGSRLDIAADGGNALPAGPARHRAVRTSVGWSHELCTPQERLMWARLSVFRDVVDAETVRAVCAGGPLLASDVDPALAGLVRKSVLSRNGDHHRMLDTVREYGRMWLDELGQTAELSDRHAQYFLELARDADAGWPGPEQARWYGRIDRANADLCAALDHLLSVRPRAALELAGLVGFFWSCCGHLRESASYLEDALALSDESGPVRTKALWALGITRVLRGERDPFRTLAGFCHRRAQAQDDDEGILLAAYLLGLTHLLQGLSMAARSEVDRTLAAVGGTAFSSAGRMLCRLVRVFALTAEGLLEQARAEAEDLRDGCVERGEWWTRSYTDYQLALISSSRTAPRTPPSTPCRCWTGNGTSATVSASRSAWTCWRRRSPRGVRRRRRSPRTGPARCTGARSGIRSAERRNWARCVSGTRTPPARSWATCTRRPGSSLCSATPRRCCGRFSTAPPGTPEPAPVEAAGSSCIRGAPERRRSGEPGGPPLPDGARIEANHW